MIPHYPSAADRAAAAQVYPLLPHYPSTAESNDEYKKRLNELLSKMQAQPIGAYMSDVVKLGQVVLWSKWQSAEGEQLCPALVTAVHEDGTVNLTIFPDGEGLQTRTQVHQGNEVGNWRLV